MFCPQCGSEYREGYTRCADCDVALVDQPPPEPSHELDLVLLHETSDVTALPVIKSVLDGAGIPYVTEGEEAFNLLPLSGSFVVPGHSDMAVEIHVPRERLEEAQALLASALPEEGGEGEADEEETPEAG
jgi:hypothetical protein